MALPSPTPSRLREGRAWVVGYAPSPTPTIHFITPLPQARGAGGGKATRHTACGKALPQTASRLREGANRHAAAIASAFLPRTPSKWLIAYANSARFNV